MTIKAIILSLLLLLNSCEQKMEEESKVSSDVGKVIAIIDGDTYDILLAENKTTRIRMEGIDAPEKGMPFYRKAKDYLGTLCFQKNIRLEVKEKDNHGRTVAYSYLDNGTELSHEMVKAGLAWHFKKYSMDTVLSNLEMQARESKIGIWSNDNPMPPWENRRLHREGISTKDSFSLN